MYSHNDQLLKLTSREKNLDFVHFLKLKVPQLHFPIHLKKKADEVSESNGIFSLKKCRVCNILGTTMTIRLTQLSEFCKLECSFIFLLPCTTQVRCCIRVVIVAVKSQQCVPCVSLTYVLLLTVALFSGKIVTVARQ
jgi:hypothetical protein